MSYDQDFDEESAPQERASDPIETLVVPVWRAKWWILALGFVGLAAGAFKAAIKVNTFDSSGKLLVRAGARESATPETLVVTGGASGQVNARETLANEIHLLRDPSVFRRVVTIVGAEQILAPYDPSSSDDANTPFVDRTLHSFQSYWSTPDTSSARHLPDECPSCLDLAAQVVERGVSIFPEPGSSVVSVSFTASTPGLAADVTNAYLKAAIDHHRDFFRGGQELELIEQRLQAARDEVIRVESSTTAFHNDCGVFDIESQSKAVLDELGTLRGEVTSEEAREAGLKGLKAFLDASLGNEPIRVVTTSEQPKMVNPQYSFLIQEKLRLELQPLGDSGGSVEKLQNLKDQRKAQMDRLDALLAAQPELIEVQPLRQISRNPLYEELMQRNRQVEGDLLALEQSQAVRRARIDTLLADRSHLESCRGQATSLTLDYANACARLAQCSEAEEKAKLLSSLDQSELTNLLVLQEANVPRTKSGPQRAKTLLIGGFLGACLGAVISLLFQKLDRRVRRAGDLERWAGVPVLESVPDVKLPRRKHAVSP